MQEAASLLNCKVCGGDVRVMNKEGAHFHVVCLSCGLDNSSVIVAQISKNERMQREENTKTVEVQIIKRKSGTRIKATWNKAKE